MLLLFIRAATALCILFLQWLLTGRKAFSFETLLFYQNFIIGTFLLQDSF